MRIGHYDRPGVKRELEAELQEAVREAREKRAEAADAEVEAIDLESVYHPDYYLEGSYWRNVIEELEEMAPENVDDPSILELCFLDALLVRKNARELGLDVRMVDAYVFRIIKRGIEIGFSPVDKFHPAIK